MKRLAIFLGLGATLHAIPVRADDAIPPIPPWMDSSDALSPISLVSGAGIKVGEGTVFQPQVGVETGVVSNVFYEETGGVAAGLLRLLVEIGTGSLPDQRLGRGGPDAAGAPSGGAAAGELQYSANLYASWDQYLSTNRNVNDQGGLGGGILVRGIVHPERPLRFAFQDNFSRLIRATNFESPEDTDRDINSLALRLHYAPTGRSLGGYLYYQNTIDVFEAGTQQFANRLQNQLGLRVNWQWLPLTRVFTDVSAGYDTGLGASRKVSSSPVTALAGIQTMLTLGTTLNAHVGYTNGFYASGPSYSSLVAGVLFGYRYSPLGRVTALYSYDHADSINANFYRDHLVQLTVEQYFAPFVVFARPELRLRRYQGTSTIAVAPSSDTRDDVIVGATAGVRYNFRDWIAGTLDYRLQDVATDFRYQTDGLILDPSYVRHELLLGVRAAY